MPDGVGVAVGGGVAVALGTGVFVAAGTGVAAGGLGVHAGRGLPGEQSSPSQYPDGVGVAVGGGAGVPLGIGVFVAAGTGVAVGRLGVNAGRGLLGEQSSPSRYTGVL